MCVALFGGCNLEITVWLVSAIACVTHTCVCVCVCRLSNHPDMIGTVLIWKPQS